MTRMFLWVKRKWLGFLLRRKWAHTMPDKQMETFIWMLKHDARADTRTGARVSPDVG